MSDEEEQIKINGEVSPSHLNVYSQVDGRTGIVLQNSAIMMFSILLY